MSERSMAKSVYQLDHVFLYMIKVQLNALKLCDGDKKTFTPSRGVSHLREVWRKLFEGLWYVLADERWLRNGLSCDRWLDTAWEVTDNAETERISSWRRRRDSWRMTANLSASHWSYNISSQIIPLFRIETCISKCKPLYMKVKLKVSTLEMSVIIPCCTGKLISISFLCKWNVC